VTEVTTTPVSVNDPGPAAIPLLLPTSDGSSSLNHRHDRSLTDLHKDLGTIFTAGTPPKPKTPIGSMSCIGNLKRTDHSPLLQPRQQSSAMQLSPSYSPGHLGAMSRVKSLSRVSLLDVPQGSGAGGSGDQYLDMYHTVTGDISASRPAIPFARITTTRRPQEATPAVLENSRTNHDAVGSDSIQMKAEQQQSGRWGDSLQDNEWGSVQGLSEEVWRVSSRGVSRRGRAG
jgi:hypothetical protein